MNTLLQELRFAVRALLRMRGLTAVATLTLAIGIAATTTMFSVVYAVLLRPLPFDEPAELAMLYVVRTTPREGMQRLRWSFPETRELPSATAAFTSLGSFSITAVNLTTGGEAEHVAGEVASAGYFRALRVPAAIGRPMQDDDARDAVVVLSNGLWRRRFGGDPAIVGRMVGVNDTPLTVVGVMPDGFAGLSGRAELWFPPAMAARLTYRDYLVSPQHFISVVGRLRPGVTVREANAELAAAAPRVVKPETSTDSAAAWSGTVQSLAAAHVDPTVSRAVITLLAAVGCVLLITCVNLACLLLARGSSRRREIAVRLAIGSGRWRVVRQLALESGVLALAGGAVAVVITMWTVDLVSAPIAIASGRNAYAALGAFAKPALDHVVLLFALGVTLATAVLFGLAPALELSRPDLVSTLKLDARSGGGRHRLLSGLVVTELALAVLLLGVAGLLVRSYAQMQGQGRSFAPEGIVTFYVMPPASRFTPGAGPRIVERLLTAVQHVPGVASASVNRCVPLDSRCASTTVFFPERRTPAAAAPMVGRHYVSADYFRTLGIPVRAGRILSDEDRDGRPLVAVVNETAAKRFWPDQNPIGRHVWFGGGTGFSNPATPVEIVGVVGDVKYGLADQPVTPDFYTSYLQFTYPDTMILVKTTEPLRSLVPALRAAVASVDRGVPLYDVQSLDDRIGASLAQPRMTASVVAAFATAALLLGAVGVYGMMAFIVASRRREMGIRLALGARRRDLISLVLGQGAKLATAGAALGLAAGMAAGRLVRGLLFGVAPVDPLSLGLTAALMMAVALAAAFLPARRASAIEPAAVLRAE